MRLLVCGSRTWARYAPGCDETRVREEAKRTCRELDALRPAVVIHGFARGADEAADTWASLARVEVSAYSANWERDGKAAGPIRNERMLRDGKPDRGLAFGALWKPHPSARAISAAVGEDVNSWKLTGTGDMVAKMLRAGLPVRWIAAHDAPAADLVTMPHAPLSPKRR